MALKKQIIDLPITDGLAQKISKFRLPLGKSAAALNLQKNKQGQLDKRLGFQSLTSFVAGTFTPGAGLALSAYQGTPVAIQRGPWSFSGATLTALSTFGLSENAWRYRGPVPECNVVFDQVTSTTGSSTIAPTEVTVGNYRIQFWISTIGGAGVGTVLYQILELATGAIVVTDQVLDANNIINRLEVINTGTSIVVVYGSTTNTTIYAQSVLNNSFPNPSWPGPTSLTTTNNSTNNAFSAAIVPGDPANWLLFYGNTNAGNTNIQVVKYSTALVSLATWPIVTASATPPVAYGLRCDGTYIIGCYALNASPYTVQIASALYSAMGAGNITAPTTIYTATNAAENKPAYLAVGLTSPGAGGAATYTVAWSPRAGVFCSRAGSPPVNTPYNNVRIIAGQFTSAAGVLTIRGGTTPTITRLTYGYHLASKFLEANGILYCLGYIPSPTQGGYVVLAADWASNGDDITTGKTYAYPMRPVAQIQTRTCLYNQFTSLQSNASAGFSVSNFNAGSDAYATATLSYLSTSQGTRTQATAGSIQFKPQSGYYPSAEWNGLTCFGGPLPMAFDGGLATEQNFLYCPDVVNTGTSTPSLMGAYGIPTTSGPVSTPFKWANAGTDTWSYIVTYEWFDDAGNFHISARSVPIVMSYALVITTWGFSNAVNYNVQLTIPTLGASYKQIPPGIANGPQSNLMFDSPVNIGIYRTINGGQTYYRIFDRSFDGNDAGQVYVNGTAPGNLTGVPPNGVVVGSVNALLSAATTAGSSYITVIDGLPDTTLSNGTYPLLYGDGSVGAPGSLDNFCPPASPVMVRHKERLFVARGNQLLYTKQRGTGLGPGYNEQVDVSYAGNIDAITGLESMDDKLVVLKQKQVYYIAGDGPADDGTGQAFSPPQPVPTDSGCLDPRSVKSTPEGVYFQSEAGLRLLTRALAVEYVGGPVEDELTTYPTVVGAVLYPPGNKLIFLAGNDETVSPFAGEWITRDYVLDAWTTGQLMPQGGSNFGAPITATIALSNRKIAPGISRTAPEPTLYFMTRDGTVWVEKDPNGTQSYYDNSVYITSLWTGPLIRPVGDFGRYRLWDIMPMLKSNDPHKLIVTVKLDYSQSVNTYTYTWDQINSGLTFINQLVIHDGRLGEGWQLALQDAEDTTSVAGHSSTGQGPTLLGITCVLGVAPDNYKLPRSVAK